MSLDVYCYGMTVASTIHRLRGGLPAADTYGEITGTWQAPGGEAMNGAMALSRLGLRTQIGGPWLGRESAPVIRRYAGLHGVELGAVTEDPSWPGVRDVVLVDDHHRTVFGWFGAYFSDPVHRWDEPDPVACATARMVCIDPWFPGSSESAARQCAAASVPYVTIDCAPESFIAGHAAAVVVSGEYRRNHQPGVDEDTLFQRYLSHGSGLVVFSAGGGRIRYGRAGSAGGWQPPFAVTVVSTLGAGDVFRAGIAFGLHQGWDDPRTVRFAAALAACACTRMPIGDTAPTLAEVEALLASG